jgi:hypothetical protein
MDGYTFPTISEGASRHMRKMEHIPSASAPPVFTVLGHTPKHMLSMCDYVNLTVLFSSTSTQAAPVLFDFAACVLSITCRTSSVPLPSLSSGRPFQVARRRKADSNSFSFSFDLRSRHFKAPRGQTRLVTRFEDLFSTSYVG